MSGLSRTPGKRVYVAIRTEGSNPSLSAKNVLKLLNSIIIIYYSAKSYAYFYLYQAARSQAYRVRDFIL